MKRGREKFKKYRIILDILSNLLRLFPNQIRIVFFNHFRMVQGNKGLAIRFILLKTILKNCGQNISVHPNVFLFNVSNLSIGNNVSIHPMCYIDAAGGIFIGNDVSIAHNVTILSSTHNYDNLDIAIKDQKIELKETKILDNVWIGAKATILAGKLVSKGVIIGAESLVVSDIPENCIVGGIPAKIIKKRS